MSVNVSTEQAREALRREHDVRVVAPEEEGLAVRDLPAGVFGFTGSAALASPLFASRRYRNFEVHRVASGPAMVGFVTFADAAKLTTHTNEPATIRVFPDAEQDATTIVSIPRVLSMLCSDVPSLCRSPQRQTRRTVDVSPSVTTAGPCAAGVFG